MPQEFTFNWQWDLKSAPEAIWPLAADTNRFNRDTGQPEVELLANVKGTKRARMKLPVLRVEWEEEPFEWTYPYSFGIVRRYCRGPLDEMRVNADFEPLPEGGTRITYKTVIVTGNLLARIGVPFAIGVIAKNRFEKAFRKYDEMVRRGESPGEMPHQHRLGAGGRARFRSQSETVIRQGTHPDLMKRLEEYLDHADELSIQRIRPYALADHWTLRANRRAVLEMCLRATRAGILDMSWDLLCPSCRAPPRDTATWRMCAGTHTATPARSISARTSITISKSSFVPTPPYALSISAPRFVWEARNCSRTL